MARNVKEHVRKSQQERREEILEATLQLISEHGIEGTTVARIADAVGLTPGALYRHFESRAALIYEANSWPGPGSGLGGVVARPDVLRRMEELGTVHAAWARQNLTPSCVPYFRNSLRPRSRPEPSG